MVMHNVFGVERNIDIPVLPTASELQSIEDAMPPCEHGWFDSCSEGAKLHYRKWVPASGKKPKAIVVFTHGIQTHSGNADVLKDGRKYQMALKAQGLLAEDYALYAHDMYGHGFSEGTRWFIPDWRASVKDCVAFCNLVSSFHDKDVPLFVMGESWGGCLSLHVARQFQDDPSSGPSNFDSPILVCPAIIGDLPPYPVYFVLRYMLAPMYPKWVPFFMPNPVSADRIWRDPEVLARKTTPRVKEMMVDGSGKPFRLGSAVQMLGGLDAAKKAIVGFTLPFLLIHGTADNAVPFAGSVLMDETVSTPADDKVFCRQEGGYHDLFSDPEGVAEDCMKVTIDWIKKRISKK
jgi:alpha-beta hydrolase superfamily lysophospholipase